MCKVCHFFLRLWWQFVDLRNSVLHASVSIMVSMVAVRDWFAPLRPPWSHMSSNVAPPQNEFDTPALDLHFPSLVSSVALVVFSSLRSLSLCIHGCFFTYCISSHVMSCLRQPKTLSSFFRTCVFLWEQTKHTTLPRGVYSYKVTRKARPFSYSAHRNVSPWGKHLTPT